MRVVRQIYLEAGVESICELAANHDITPFVTTR
jgi:hypothetical protein